MTILDTNVVSEAMTANCNPSVERWLASQSRDDLWLTAPTLAEVLAGIAMLAPGRRKAALRAAFEQLMQKAFTSAIIPFDDKAAHAYADIVATARRSGQVIAPFDGQIAAIAVVHRLAVATRDTAPFIAAGVAVIDPWLDGR